MARVAHALQKLARHANRAYVLRMQSIFAWPGGKRNLLPALLARIPAHRIYVEGFSGSAKLLFAKEPSVSEVINDTNGELISFYRVAKHRPAELAELLEHEIVHPERFKELRHAGSADELERAAAFLYTAWYSYGAKGEHFAAASLKEVLVGRTRRPLCTVRDVLERATARLQRVRIEQRDIQDVLKRFDSPETFYYLDPPYVKFDSVGRYSSWEPQKRAAMFETLAALKAQFLLSFDDSPEVRDLASAHGMAVEEVQTRYGLGSTTASRQPVTELLITPRPIVEMAKAA